MIKHICIATIPLIIYVFCGTAVGGQKKDMVEKIKTNESGYTKGYCIDAYADWCQEKCDHVSPTAPSGSVSNIWGDNCTQGKRRKCQECGYVANRD